MKNAARVGALVWILATAVPALGGPPFLTDDPEPVPFHHYEAYLFSTAERDGGTTAWGVPAAEFNVGVVPNVQLHVVVPGAGVSPGDAYGIGDVEVGAKYRFVDEGAHRPQIGTFPMLELPTGNGRLGLGNGQLWARLPVWLQKSWGPWQTYGGAGYEINHAPGMKDSAFAGWQVQRQVSKRLVLGAEIYHQQAQTIGARHTTLLDPGGYFNFTPHFSLLFMAGHTISGDSRTVAYLGLYWTWGHH